MTHVDPITAKSVVKRKRNKGRQPTSRLTINGRVRLRRRLESAERRLLDYDELRRLAALPTRREPLIWLLHRTRP